jgi:hypothetical protein
VIKVVKIKKVSAVWNITIPERKLAVVHGLTLIPKEESDGIPIDVAYWLLQEFNTQAYVNKIKEKPTTDPPLLFIEWTGIVGTIRGPRQGLFPGTTIEESLHKMDSSTPIDQKYDMLHPREINIAATSYTGRMRDYSFPIFDLPAMGVMGQKVWSMKGYIIVAEQFAHDIPKICFSTPNNTRFAALLILNPQRLPGYDKQKFLTRLQRNKFLPESQLIYQKMSTNNLTILYLHYHNQIHLMLKDPVLYKEEIKSVYNQMMGFKQIPTDNLLETLISCASR